MRKFYKIFLLISVGIGSSDSFSQSAQPDLPNPGSNPQTAAIGSLVIPMDNVNQDNGGLFNLKSYGLVHTLLMNDIPVKWIISAGKIKDAIDFSATAERLYPSFVASATVNFIASAFIIDSFYVNNPGLSGQTATQVITSFANNVAVFRLTQNVTVDVRYTLNFRPKIAVFDNGGNQPIHIAMLNAGGVTNYVAISAGVFTGLAECYTFCSEAHWASTIADTAIMRKPVDFIYSGGNFFAQCHAVQTNTDGYEANMKIQTTNGLTEIGIATASNSYYNPDLAIMQFHGAMQANEGGSGKNWRLAPGSSWRSGHYYAVSTQNAVDTVVFSGAHLTNPDSAGGNVFYLGGHDYSPFTTLPVINAARLYLNATLIPSGRPSPFTIDAGPSPTICAGQSVTLGGNPTTPVTATYLWSPASSLNNATSPNPVATPTATTIYNIFADNGGCTANGTLTVTVTNAPSATATASNISCFGGSNGTATATATGGTPAYTYLWSNGQTTSTATGLIAGNYSITVTDVIGCSAITQSVTITQPAVSLSASPSQNNVLCFGGSNGSASVSSSGGTPSYTYLWSSGQTTSSATGLPAGNYSVTTTDANGCTITTTVSITQPAVLTSSVSQTNVSCFGGSNGTASVSSSGGTIAYTYLWSNGQTTSSTTGLLAGNYSVATTDANGCTTTNTVSITQPAAPLSSSSSQNNVSCFGGSNGTAAAAAAGGSPNYTYFWSNGQTASSATNLSAGNYSVTITDANGCTTTASFTVTQPTVLSSTASQTNICSGASNGSTTVSVSGGTLAYTYLWSNGQTTVSATGLPAGNYSVTVTDANGCSAISTGTVTLFPAVTSTSSQTNVSCFGGSNGNAALTISSGTSPFTYIWNNGQTTSSATGLLAGNYSVTITDANGCTTTQTVTIIQPALLTATAAATAVSCFGGNNGTASVTAAGGTPAYTYLWSNGQTTSSATGFIAGNYSVTVWDANGCTSTNTVSITQPASALASSSSQNNVSCNGGSNGTAAVAAAGGSPNYTYFWSSGQTTSSVTGLTAGNYSVTVTDANGCTNSITIIIIEPTLLTSTASQTNTCSGASSGTAAVAAAGGTVSYTYLWSTGQTTSSVTGLPAGNYSVSVTDANGCTSSATVTINLFPAVTVSSLQTSVSCFGGNNGSATANASGGTSPFTYLWSSGQTTSTSTGLTAGNYSVTITDANGCTVLDTISVNEPTAIAANHSSTNSSSCVSNGTATVNASGGIPPYAYLWINGQATATATGLSPGNYSVTITDTNGCTFIDTVNVNGFGAPLANAGPDASICLNNSTTLTASGGITYSWSTGATTTSISVSPTATVSYTVIATDANGCTAADTVMVTVNPLPPANAGANVSICLNSSTTLTASGGTNYSWSSGQTTSSITATATTTATATYTVIVTDANGCSAPAFVTVAVNPLPVANAGTDISVCPNTLTTLNASGGGSYSWSNGATTANVVFIPTSTTTYTIIVTDANGCTDDDDVTVAVIPPPLANAGADASICAGASITLNASGGNSFSWNTGATTATVAVAPAVTTTYTVTVTNATGCSASDTVIVTVNQPPVVSINVSPSNGCAPLTVTFSGISDTSFTFLWDFGDNTTAAGSTVIHNYITAGTYTASLTVTGTNGCLTVVTTPAPIDVYPKPMAYFTTSPSVTPIPNNNPTINFNNQSSGAISYDWDFGDGATSNLSDPQHKYAAIGFYTVTLITTNQYGCKDTFRIQTTGEGDITFPNAFTPNANGPNGGGYNPFNLDNDVFFPFASGVEEFNMLIFNRWGELIFETVDIRTGWDGYYRGKLCQQDVYVWKAYAKFIDGRTFSKAGDVTLLQ